MLCPIVHSFLLCAYLSLLSALLISIIYRLHSFRRSSLVVFWWYVVWCICSVRRWFASWWWWRSSQWWWWQRPHNVMPKPVWLMIDMILVLSLMLVHQDRVYLSTNGIIARYVCYFTRRHREMTLFNLFLHIGWYMVRPLIRAIHNPRMVIEDQATISLIRYQR